MAHHRRANRERNRAAELGRTGYGGIKHAAASSRASKRKVGRHHRAHGPSAAAAGAFMVAAEMPKRATTEISYLHLRRRRRTAVRLASAAWRVAVTLETLLAGAHNNVSSRLRAVKRHQPPIVAALASRHLFDHLACRYVKMAKWQMSAG